MGRLVNESRFKKNRDDRRAELAELLAKGVELRECHWRMGYSAKGIVYALFKELELATFGPPGLSREERVELRR